MQQSFTADAQYLIDAVVPTGAYYYGAACIGPGTQGKWTTHPLQDHKSVVSFCKFQSEHGNNTYFALSAFKQAWYTTSSGKKVFRTQENAVCQKSLWLDIDCGKGDSPYPDATAGVAAVTEFLKKTGMPLPIVIGSGQGIHVYWAFTAPIPTAQWRQVAQLLRAACDRHDLKADHSRTCDAASVLRLPGTWNTGKDGTVRPVKLLIKAAPYPVVDLAKKLLAATPGVSLSNPAPKVQPPLQVPTPPAGLQFDGLTMYTEGPKRHPLRIIKECRQIQRAGIGTYSQWYNMMLVMKHCAFGEQAVHDISKMDPSRYDKDNVDRKLQEAIDGGYGPCRCETFDNKDPGICPNCPYWGKIGSPLLLGEPYVEKKPVDIPAMDVEKPGVVDVQKNKTTMQVVPFSNSEFSVVPGQGIIMHKRTLVENGEENNYVTKDYLICDTEIYIHSIYIDNTKEEKQRSYAIRKQAKGCAPEDILFDVNTALGPQQLLKWLGVHGMLPIHPKYNKAMGDFMSTYLAAVQNKLPEVYVRDRFGWVTEIDKRTGIHSEGFILGHNMHLPGGRTKSVQLDGRAERLGHALATSGNLEAWKIIPKMYEILNQPFAQLLMLCSLAAPLMSRGNGTATNVAYSLWDARGGKGKSCLLEAMASVWGIPRGMLQTKNDTTASRFQKCAVYRNLPILIDEVTNIQDNALSDLIYDLVNGQEKSRSVATGTGLAKSGDWSTISVFTSNRSLYETLKGHHVQSDATCMRVIEMQCDFEDYTGTPIQKHIREVLDIVRKNYGLAGEVMIKYLVDHPDEVQQVVERANKFAQMYQKTSDERFWLYGIAIPLYTGYLAKEAGLITYDLRKLEEWCVEKLLPALREQVKRTTITGDNLLTEFVNDNLDYTLVVESESRPASMPKNPANPMVDPYVKYLPSHKVHMRLEADTQTLYVSVKYFRTWCQMNKLSSEVILQDLLRSGRWQKQDKMLKALGKDVPLYDRGRTTVYKFNLRAARPKLTLADVL